MEQALYHPEHGYYSSDRAAIGRRGDYFTNVSVGPLFGQLLAVQFAEIWEATGKASRISPLSSKARITASSRAMFLEFSRRRLPEFFSALNYRIVEPFPKLHDRQRANAEGIRRSSAMATRHSMSSNRSLAFIFPTNCSMQCRSICAANWSAWMAKDSSLSIRRRDKPQISRNSIGSTPSRRN